MKPIPILPSDSTVDAASGASAPAPPHKASAHTAAQLHGWMQAGITHADLAIRRADGVMLWQHDQPLDDLPLPWARAHNVRHADIYIRPARNQCWRVVFLDDVALQTAQGIARKYAAVVVHTSALGGCHLWLRTTITLDQRQRYQAQRWLAPRVGADPGSVSGEHLGRLAGMKNHKRHGVWVNTLDCGNFQAPAWDPTPVLQSNPSHHRPPIATSSRTASTSIDQSESGREWGWVCAALEAGTSPDAVYRKLLERASPRRARDAERYARYTVERAVRHVR